MSIQIGKIVAEFRKSKGLLQKELARRAGMCAAQLCQIESGRVSPAFQMVERLAAALGTDVQGLLAATAKVSADPVREEPVEIAGLDYVPVRATEPDAARALRLVAESERLRDKLAAFLPTYRVTVVFPVMRAKYLCWVDPDTGEVLSRRKSPRGGLVTDILPEISALKDAMFAPGLDYLVVLVDGEEYRLKDGWGSDGKRGSHGIGKTPFEYAGTVRIAGPKDLKALLPAQLSEAPFTRTELGRALKISARSGMKLGFAKNTLEKSGVIAPVGKRGREILYQITEETKP